MLYDIIKVINQCGGDAIIGDIDSIIFDYAYDETTVKECIGLMQSCYKVDATILKEFLSVYRTNYSTYGGGYLISEIVADMVYKTKDFCRELIHEYDI